MQVPNNLLLVYEMYVEEINLTKPEKSRTILNELRTTLLHHLLPEFGYVRTQLGRKMTANEVESAIKYMEKLPISKLLKMRQALQSAFEKNNVSKHSRNTYGSRIEQFLNWAAQQIWWPGSRQAKLKLECSPSMRTQHGLTSSSKLTERLGTYRKYILKPQETPPILRAKLDELYAYLTEPYWPGRIVQPVQKSTSDEYMKNIRLFLGFLHRFQKVPLEELSLELIVPLITEEKLESLTASQQNKLWKYHKKALEQFLCSYFQFLKDFNSSVSPHTQMGKVNAIVTIAKFLYAQEVETDSDYRAIPLFSTIDNRLKEVSLELESWRNNKHSVSDWSKRWPDVPPGQTALQVIQERIVEPLRWECRPRNKRGDFRRSFLIAISFQSYLKWALLAYLPARRQEEYRKLKIALSCPIERPKDIPPDGLYQPLPPDNQRERGNNGMVADNYLYFTYNHDNQYYPKGIWVLSTNKYKTMKKYGGQSIIIPNREFDDGHCFYDYIERFLYGWWTNEGYKNTLLYDWWQPESQGRRGRWLSSGRMEFNPMDTCCLPSNSQSALWAWGYVFVVPKCGIPATASSFARIFETISHRFLKKRISPHMMRYVWATWGLQIGLSDPELRSLAYAMGHSVETLRQMYERCTPVEKRRPIEEAIAQRLLAPDDKKSQSLPLNLGVNELLQMAMQLKPIERQELIARLQSVT
ncbi:hypothetical protein [Nostoc sp.]|uniref:hypothetical protein n=1 Tax=Nostoc sp. TaxID=1180 RepID=UPI002FFC8722